MALLEELGITNFRGFDTLEIKGLSKINLFVGKNNSGKTSILEALFLLFCMSNPASLIIINQIRGLKFFSPNQFKYLFNKLEFENKPFLNAVFSDSSERDLELSARFQYQENIPAFQQPKNNLIPIAPSPSVLSPSEITGIDLSFSKKDRSTSSKDSKKSSALYDATNGTINYTSPNNYKENLHVAYINPDKDDFTTLTRYSEIVKRNENKTILETLQKFDSNIENIQPLPDGIYFKLKNVTELVPCNIMGDGIRRFLNIVTAVSEKHNAFVLIDEIENGLHYSAYELLWKGLISYSQQNDVQLFITTHNIETLESLRAVLEESLYKEMRNYSKVFSISKTAESKYKAYKYSYEEFKTAIENDLELRK